MAGFTTGAKALASGFRIILRPGVRVYVLIPLSINLLLFATAFIYGAGQVGRFTDWLTLRYEWVEWVAWLLWPLFIIFALLLLFFCFSILANLLAAPFNGFLAEAVELSLTGTKPLGTENRPLLQEMRSAVRSEAAKLAYFTVRVFFLLLVFLVPLLNVAAPLLWFLFGAWMLALEYLEFPMSNNGLTFPEARARLRQHRPLVMGFGAGVLVLTVIPIVNFLVMPVAVAAATKLWVESVRPIPPA